jgi:hypothetical protein
MDKQDIICISSILSFLAIITIIAILAATHMPSTPTVKYYNGTIIAIGNSSTRYSDYIYPVLKLTNGKRYTVELDGMNTYYRTMVIGDRVTVGIASDNTVDSIQDTTPNNSISICIEQYAC